jgi:hypothetical protein
VQLSANSQRSSSSVNGFTSEDKLVAPVVPDVLIPILSVVRGHHGKARLSGVARHVDSIPFEIHVTSEPSGVFSDRRVPDNADFPVGGVNSHFRSRQASPRENPATPSPRRQIVSAMS